MTAQPWHKRFKRKSKEDRTYRNIVFDSVLEMKKYQELLTMEMAGEIRNIKVQVQHELKLPNGVEIKTPKGRVAYYTSDFEWDDCKTGHHVIADAKGFLDRHSAFRIAVFEAISGQKVLILK